LASADNAQHLPAAFLKDVRDIDNLRIEIGRAKFGLPEVAFSRPNENPQYGTITKGHKDRH
jgi:stage III sporulation protein SpoIIIAA